jgi:NADH-quinone oxidoreductase subunit G
MPRQNERVNEIWICDKGRFVHHFASSPERLTQPLIRENGELVEATWDEALDLVAGRLQLAKGSVAGLANDRLSNEDMFVFQKLFRQGLNSNNVDLFDKRMGGGEVVSKVGITSGSNIQELTNGDSILVVASNLIEEAPIWWLRVKQAAERGVSVIVLNLRPTRLDKYAQLVIRFDQGEALSTVYRLLNASKVETDGVGDDLFMDAAETLINADNLVVFYGGEGLSTNETESLAQMLGNLLLVKQRQNDDQYHAGKVNNGLIPVWPRANTQGALDMGINPEFGPGYQPLSDPGLDALAVYSAAASGDLEVLYLIGADPVGDGLLEGRGRLKFLVVQELFMTESAKIADVVLPAQSWAEREGTYTSGERRVQRFYPAILTPGACRPDWQIIAQIGERVGLERPPLAPSLLFREIADSVPHYEGLDYRGLAWTEDQWPEVGGDDVYYGGTSYDNRSGLGVQWPSAAESTTVPAFESKNLAGKVQNGLVLVPVISLYDRGTLIDKTELLRDRSAVPVLHLNSGDAREHTISDGDHVYVNVNGLKLEARAEVGDHYPSGVALISGVAGNQFTGAVEVVKKRGAEA